jgi:hypothetical protein
MLRSAGGSELGRADLRQRVRLEDEDPGARRLAGDGDVVEAQQDVADLVADQAVAALDAQDLGGEQQGVVAVEAAGGELRGLTVGVVISAEGLLVDVEVGLDAGLGVALQLAGAAQLCGQLAPYWSGDKRLEADIEAMCAAQANPPANVDQRGSTASRRLALPPTNSFHPVGGEQPIIANASDVCGAVLDRRATRDRVGRRLARELRPFALEQLAVFCSADEVDVDVVGL